MNSSVPSFQDVVQSRHSVRGFLSAPIPRSVLEEVLQEAQYAPSNCNTQPWNEHVVSGGKRQELSAILVDELRAEHDTLDFSFDKNDYPEPYRTRVAEQGGCYYQALGVAQASPSEVPICCRPQ